MFGRKRYRIEVTEKLATYKTPHHWWLEVWYGAYGLLLMESFSTEALAQAAGERAVYQHKNQQEANKRRKVTYL